MLDFKNIAVIGSSGEIGNAFVQILSNQYPNANLYAFSRKGPYEIDYSNEDSIAQAANVASSKGSLDLVFVANGMLHSEDITPEKSMKEISKKNFQQLFEVNVIVPALIAKYFLPHLNRDNKSVFASLSAQVGSISDNQLGGWYAYRSSKAALNMMIKNASIEIRRKNQNAIVIGLHPGTVDTSLSRPFHKNIPIEKLFTPSQSAEKLLQVITSVTHNKSGKCISWNGEEILP